ncbi:MAG: metallophosphoesterase [Clostridia bacterium]|nr:metallophosphoesterase [Clostridia bacterium]
MKVYAISDLHLSLSGEKPMDIFGDKWDGYLEKIKRDWQERVNDDDVVLIAGDISWAMKLDEAIKDLSFFDGLKGKKIIIRGNHDYWWQGITKIRESLPSDIFALQNDCLKIGNVVFCGSRGWAVEGSPDFDEHDRHIYEREVERFKLALNSAKKTMQEGDKLICLIHYPPFNVRKESSLFTKLFESYGVDKVVYGHLHGKGVVPYRNLSINGVEYVLSSCDLVDNKLVEVLL